MGNITDAWYCQDCFQDFKHHERVIEVSAMNSVFCRKCGNGFPREWRKALTYQRPE